MPMKYLKPTKYRKNSRQSKPKKDKKRRLPQWLTLYNLFAAAVFTGLICAILFVGWVAVISRELPSTDGLLTRDIPESTKILDRTGEHILNQIHGDERRTAIEFEALPPHVSQAFIAIEDKDFYQHNGLLFKRLVKAVYDDGMYVLKRTFIPTFIREALGIRLNKIQGASTITQQFIKNAVLTPEKKVSRKVKEMILAWQLEKKFTKEQILKMYLNEISYGGVNYGIESAAQSYFKKSAGDLTVAESAILAAMINAPSRLSPYGNHKDELFARQQFILKLMFEQGYLGLEEYEQSKAEEIVFSNIRTGSIEAPHFVMYVRQLLEEDFGAEESAQLLKEGGLRVYTTLDYDMQKMAEDVITEKKEHLTDNNASNAALVAMNPKNGEIMAMVGSVDYFALENDGNFNAALGLRQPGSSIKPLVYLSAFQKGFYPESMVYDVETDFDLSGTKPYVPKNYNLKELGPVTLRKALAGSLNIPAVKALYLAGVDTVSENAQKLGYTTLGDKDRYGLSLVLGGAEVKLLEHVTAYGAFANEGVVHPSKAILRIEDRDGNVITEYDKDGSKQVFDANAVRMLNDVLSDNDARSYAFGENNVLVVKDHTVAAKTGTTNDYRDGWLVGYTPNLVAGVWTGNNNNKAMRRGAGGSRVAGPIWNAFMKQALDAQPDRELFNDYPENLSENPALNGALVDGVKVRIDTISGKLATEHTPAELVEEKIYQDPHSILHYVNKDDAFAGIPENPAQDAQYENWEQAIQDWIVRYNEKALAEGQEPLEITAPPTEFDDVHFPELIPTMNVMQPAANSVFTDENMFIQVDAQSQGGVDEIIVEIDGRQVASIVDWPYELNYQPQGVYNGRHTMTIKACDFYKNCARQDIPFELQLPGGISPLSVVVPSNGQRISRDAFPFEMIFNVDDYQVVQFANVYVQNRNTGERELVRSVENISSVTNVVEWKHPPLNGDYDFYLEAIDYNGNAILGQPYQITIE
jgi:membrane peptidoglycan carboxypeptidase